MAISILMRFSSNETITLDTYDTINISRQNKQLDINITSSKKNLALNNMYDRITELQGKDETFSIAVISDESKAEFDNITADYYNSGDVEILHLAMKRLEQLQALQD